MIGASYETLLRQAPATVRDYLAEAVRMLDEQFERGYAKANPGLVGQLVATMAEDFRTGALLKAGGEAVAEIAAAISSIAG